MYVEASDGTGGGLTSETYQITVGSSSYITIEDDKFLGKTIGTDCFMGIKGVTTRTSVPASTNLIVEFTNMKISTNTFQARGNSSSYVYFTNYSLVGYFI